MDPKIKDLIMLFTDSELILQECKDLKAYLSLELQALRDDRRVQHSEFQELMAEVKNVLTQIQARFMIDAQLLDLVRPEETREDVQAKGIQKSNRNRDNGRITVNYSKPS